MKNLGMVFEKLQREIMHPPFKGACTKRLVALAKKAAIRVFFFCFLQVCKQT